MSVHRLNAYNAVPVGGGFFTGRYHDISGAVEPGSRFDPQRNQGRVRVSRHVRQARYLMIVSCRCTASGELCSETCLSADGAHMRRRYWKEAYFKALASIEEVAAKHGLTVAEVALRWMTHHSFLKHEYGDTVIIGASSLRHIDQVCHS